VPTRRGRRRATLLLAVALLAGAGAVGAVFIARDRATAEAIAQALPPPPDLTGWPPEFAQRLAEAGQGAVGGPDRVKSLSEVALLYHANGFLVEARQAYRGLLDADADNPRWYHMLAGVEADFGLVDEAVPLMQIAAHLASDSAPVRLRLADLLLKVGRVDEARAAYRDVLSIDASNPHALAGLARLDIDAGHPETALPLLERATAGEPEFESAWSMLSNLRASLGDAAGAAEAARKAGDSLRFNEAPDPWSELLVWYCYDVYRLRVAAVTSSRSNDGPRRLSILQRAERLAPNDGDVARELGRVFLSLGRDAEAEAQLRRATELSPSVSDAWGNLADLLRRSGRVREADDMVIKGLLYCPQSPYLLFERGRMLIRERQFEQALAVLEESRRIRPEEPRAHIEIARLLMMQGRVEEGVASLREAQRARPEEPVSLSALAVYAIESGNEAEARDLMRRVRAQPKIPPEDAQALTQKFRQRFSSEP